MALEGLLEVYEARFGTRAGWRCLGELGQASGAWLGGYYHPSYPSSPVVRMIGNGPSPWHGNSAIRALGPCPDGRLIAAIDSEGWAERVYAIGRAFHRHCPAWTRPEPLLNRGRAGCSCRKGEEPRALAADAELNLTPREDDPTPLIAARKPAGKGEGLHLTKGAAAPKFSEAPTSGGSSLVARATVSAKLGSLGDKTGTKGFGKFIAIEVDTPMKTIS